MCRRHFVFIIRLDGKVSRRKHFELHWVNLMNYEHQLMDWFRYSSAIFPSFWIKIWGHHLTVPINTGTHNSTTIRYKHIVPLDMCTKCTPQQCTGPSFSNKSIDWFVRCQWSIIILALSRPNQLSSAICLLNKTFHCVVSAGVICIHKNIQSHYGRTKGMLMRNDICTRANDFWPGCKRLWPFDPVRALPQR